MTEQTYIVTGMTCEHCVRAVTEEVGAVAGVDAVAVQLSTGRLVVTSPSPVAADLIDAAVREAGYQLAGRP
jgi:copper ion binding protein